MTERVGIEVFVDPRKAETGARKAEKSLNSLERQADRTESQFKSLNTSSRLVGRGLTALAAAFSVREVVRYSDAWTSVNNKIRQVTNSQDDLRSSTKSVYDIAVSTRSNLEATATLYARTARRADELGISQKQVATFTKAVNQSLQAYGATSAESASATLQLSQALGKGVLNGDEFRAVSEAAPPIITAIADAAGVAEGKLKEMGANGELSAKLVVQGVLLAADKFNNDFSKAVATASSKMEVARSITTKWVGENRSLAAGVSKLGDSAILLADNLDGIATAGQAALAVFAARNFGPGIASLSAAAAAAANLSNESRTGSVVILNSAKALEQKALSAKTAAAASQSAATAIQKTAAAELAGIKATQAALVAERLLEETRLKAQITAIGRQQSLTRLAEIRRSETIIARQTAEAEAQLTAAKNASVAASGRAAAATAVHNAALSKTTVLARSAAIATRAASSAMALVGGPAGAAILAAYGIYELVSAMNDSKESAKRAAEEVDSYRSAIKDLNDTQKETALVSFETDVNSNLQKQIKLREKIDQLRNGKVAPGQDVGFELQKAKKELEELERTEGVLREKLSALFNSRLPDLNIPKKVFNNDELDKEAKRFQARVDRAILDLKRRVSEESEGGDSALAQINFELSQGELKGASAGDSRELINLAKRQDTLELIKTNEKEIRDIVTDGARKAQQETAKRLQEFAALENSLLTPIEQINSAYEQRRLLIDSAGVSAAKAFELESRSAAQRDAEIRRLVAQQQQEIISVENELLTPVERVNKAYAERAQIIQKSNLSQARASVLLAKSAAKRDEELKRIAEQEVVGFDAIFGKGSLDNLFQDFENIEDRFKGMLARLVVQAAQAQLQQAFGLSTGGKQSFTDVFSSFTKGEGESGNTGLTKAAQDLTSSATALTGGSGALTSASTGALATAATGILTSSTTSTTTLTTAATALTAAAAALTGAATALAASAAASSASSSASGIGSLLTGGKANGGRFGRRELFPVNERGPELITVGNRQALMTNGSRGKITPNEQIASSTTKVVNSYVTVIAPDPPTFRKAESRLALDVKRKLA